MGILAGDAGGYLEQRLIMAFALKVMGDVDHDVIQWDEVVADGVGEGRAVGQVEMVGWVGDVFFIAIPG